MFLILIMFMIIHMIIISIHVTVILVVVLYRSQMLYVAPRSLCPQRARNTLKTGKVTQLPPRC